MANDINQVVLVGRLTRDADIKQINNNLTIAEFSLANGRTFTSNNEKREETAFINCVAFGRLAEIIQQYTQKGKQVAVTGRLKQDRWVDKDTNKNRDKIVVVVENFQLLGSARDGGGDGQSSSSSSYQESSNQGGSYGNSGFQGGSTSPGMNQNPSASYGQGSNRGTGNSPASYNEPEFNQSDDDMPF